MIKEIDVAVQFIVSLITQRLAKPKADEFSIVLKKHGSWYENEPWRGQANRCVRVDSKMDPVLEMCSQLCGINNLHLLLPSNLIIWIDPNSVCYKMSDSDRQPETVLYCIESKIVSPVKEKQLSKSKSSNGLLSHNRTRSVSESSGSNSSNSSSRSVSTEPVRNGDSLSPQPNSSSHSTSLNSSPSMKHKNVHAAPFEYTLPSKTGRKNQNQNQNSIYNNANNSMRMHVM
eukprot:Pgem_evm1s1313